MIRIIVCYMGSPYFDKLPYGGLCRGLFEGLDRDVQGIGFRDIIPHNGKWKINQTS